MSDEDIIIRRLMFDGDGTGEDRRLNDLVKNIAKWLKTDHKNEEDCLVMFDTITAQLESVKQSRRFANLRHKQADKELEMYTKLYDTMEAKIKERKDEIETQKVDLKKSKIIKQNQMHYNMLSKSINQEPPRKDTLQYLDYLRSDIKDLEAQKEQLDEALNTRRKPFKVLAMAASDLHEKLSKEEADGGNKATKERIRTK